jgi:hypothetical protein
VVDRQGSDSPVSKTCQSENKVTTAVLDRRQSFGGLAVVLLWGLGCGGGFGVWRRVRR